MEEIFRKYFDLTEKTYDLLLEENKILKTVGDKFDDTMLDRKKELLDELRVSVKEIKVLGREGPIEGIRSRELMEKTEKKMMKIFLLDRENQQLMLEKGFERKMELSSDAVSVTTAKNAYSQFYQ